MGLGGGEDGMGPNAGPGAVDGPGGGIGGGGSEGGGSEGASMGGQGGFGGLGIGNPGSYGGQQSVGAPGFSGGYGDAGGVSGYGAGETAMDGLRGLYNLAAAVMGLKSPFGWSNVQGNYDAAKQNFNSMMGKLGTMGFSAGSLSPGLAGSGGGGGEFGEAANTLNFLSGLQQQNEQTGLAAPTSLEAIFKSMYAGENPQFNLPQMMGDYTTRITDATTEYAESGKQMADEWKDFENRFFGVLEQYDEGVSGLPAVPNPMNAPTMNMVLPAGMGGGSIPLFGGRYADAMQQQANNVFKQADILNSQAQARAGILSGALPAMANRANIPLNQYKAQIGTADALMKPFDTAYDIFKMDKAIAADKELANINKPEEPSLWDSLIPAAGYAIGSWLGSE